MIRPISSKRGDHALGALPVVLQSSLHWIVLKIKALKIDSDTKVSDTIIENTRAMIQRHHEGNLEADRLRQAARRTLKIHS
jgi:hypothetical protein